MREQIWILKVRDIQMLRIINLKIKIDSIIKIKAVKADNFSKQCYADILKGQEIANTHHISN